MPDTAMFLPRAGLNDLFSALKDDGYQCIGPTVHESAIVYRPIGAPDDLPQGWHDHQSPGEYRLERHDGPRSFDWAVGPEALKPMNFASRETLWRAGRDENGHIRFEQVIPQVEKRAIIGVRACDLAALKLQDQHFLEGPHRDPYYAARREGLFLVAVHCNRPADTCFCASTGDGPRAEAHFDLAFYENDEGFIVEAGSERGRDMLQRLPLEPVSAIAYEAALETVEAAGRNQTRRLPGRNLRDPLFERLEHPRWTEVAGRCLSCANCTSVCPTCFCHTEGDAPALNGETTEHQREWGSCFTAKHSYVGGWIPRSDTRLRYRQWLTHKLGSWHDQYGRSGCTGCGRCITWCPAGIDITEEAAAICGDTPS